DAGKRRLRISAGVVGASVALAAMVVSPRRRCAEERDCRAVPIAGNRGRENTVLNSQRCSYVYIFAPVLSFIFRDGHVLMPIIGLIGEVHGAVGADADRRIALGVVSI